MDQAQNKTSRNFRPKNLKTTTKTKNNQIWGTSHFAAGGSTAAPAVILLLLLDLEAPVVPLAAAALRDFAPLGLSQTVMVPTNIEYYMANSKT